MRISVGMLVICSLAPKCNNCSNTQYEAHHCIGFRDVWPVFFSWEYSMTAVLASFCLGSCHLGVHLPGSNQQRRLHSAPRSDASNAMSRPRGPSRRSSLKWGHYSDTDHELFSTNQFLTMVSPHFIIRLHNHITNIRSNIIQTLLKAHYTPVKASAALTSKHHTNTSWRRRWPLPCTAEPRLVARPAPRKVGEFRFFSDKSVLLIDSMGTQNLHF